MKKQNKVDIGKLYFNPGKPMQIQFDLKNNNLSQCSQREKTTATAVAKTVKAYMKTVNELVNGKFAHIKHLAPLYLKEPCQVVCCIFKEGIIIRYDISPDGKPRVISCFTNDSLIDIMPQISESVVFCYTDSNSKSLIPTNGREIVLTKTDGKTGDTSTIGRIKIGFDVILKPVCGELPKKPAKPHCAINVRNTFELVMEGLMQSTEKNKVMTKNLYCVIK